jgi:hypothetical protein
MEPVKIAKKGTKGTQGKDLSFLVRFKRHESLLNSLKQQAQKDKRSINQQVLFYLENQLESNRGSRGEHL